MSYLFKFSGSWNKVQLKIVFFIILQFIFYMRRTKISPHQSCKPSLNHFTNVKWRTRGEGRSGITLHVFPACRCWEIDQLFLRRHPIKIWNALNYFPAPFRHVQRRFWASWSKQQWKLTQNWLLWCAFIFLIGAL